jgi:hypothetical protein
MKARTLITVMIATLVVPMAASGMASFDYPVVSFVQGDVAVKGAGAGST